MDMTQFVLDCLGLKNYRVRFGFRDPNSDKYVGDAANWEAAQQSLLEVCQSLGIQANIELGEAAFYGPKADFVVKDCIGREWQLGTVQLDYNLPSEERFDLEYIGADNRPHRPVMIHRAPLGSLERFMGVLIEHFAGAFPLWLAPEQVRVLVVSQKFEEYGRQVETAAGRRRAARVRATIVRRKSVRRSATPNWNLCPICSWSATAKSEHGEVSVRDRIDGDQGAMKVQAAIEKLQQEVLNRTVRQTFGGDAGLGERGARNEY